MRRTIKTDVFCLFITLDPEQIISRITSGKAQILFYFNSEGEL